MTLRDKNLFGKMRLFAPQRRTTGKQSARSLGLANREQPPISQQQYKEFSGIISEAVLNQSKVKITLYSQFGDEIVVGVPFIEGDLKMKTAAGAFKVPFERVIGIRPM